MSISLSANATSKQILLSYTAPNTSACTIEVSEDPAYSPAVNDVNSTLFSGANSDDRTGALGAGTTSRAIVIGTIPQPAGTIANLAGDSRRYGRALRPNTTHYIRVTCGAEVGTTSITTKNIPLGNTYPNPIPVGAAGTYGFPSADWTNRAEVITDESTGLRIRHVGITADNDGGGDFLLFNDTGSQWPFAQSAVNDSSGNAGYLFHAPTQNGTARLFWINTANGVVRFLGTLRLASGALTGIGTSYLNGVSSIFGTDPTKLYNIVIDTLGDLRVVRLQLPASGDTYYDTSVAPGTFVSGTWTDMTPSPNTLSALLLSFDATYDKTKFAGANYQHVQGNYMLFALLRHNQDSYGWMGAVDVSGASTATLTGAMPMWKRGSAAGGNNFRWCGFHTPHQALGTTKFSWTAKELYQTPYQVTLSGSITDVATSLTLSSNTPSTTDVNLDATLYALQAGDLITIEPGTGNAEMIKLNSLTSGTTWNVTRGQIGTTGKAHTNGVAISASCAATSTTDNSVVSINWWDFVNDTGGNNTDNTLLKQINDGVNGHEGWANGYKIGEGGWQAAIGAAATSLSSFAISNSPTFAGKAKSASGNAWQQHPSPPQQSSANATQGTNWGLDALYLDADPEACSTTVTNVTGTLFKWVNTAYTLAPKTFPVLAVAGSHVMLDISSAATGNVIGGLAADNYKYCIANAVNECRTGSAVGDIYFNAPNATTGSSCVFGTLPPESSVCISHLPTVGQQIVQIGIVEANSTGKWVRALSQFLSPLKFVSSTVSTHTTPDGKWVLVAVRHDSIYDVIAIEVPPWPGYDGHDRNTFIQKPITLTTLGGADNAIIEFGYDANFYCTSRNEVCVSAASNNPYFFASETFTGYTLPNTGYIPVLPDRTVYYRIKWRNGGTLVQTSDTFLLAEDSAPLGAGGGGTPQPHGKLIAICM